MREDLSPCVKHCYTERLVASLLLMEGSMSWQWSNTSKGPLGFASAVRKNALYFPQAERFLLIGCHVHKSDWGGEKKKG